MSLMHGIIIALIFYLLYTIIMFILGFRTITMIKKNFPFTGYMTYLISGDTLPQRFIEIDLFEALVYIIDIKIFWIIFVSCRLF